jgi:hypothetical protein
MVWPLAVPALAVPGNATATTAAAATIDGMCLIGERSYAGPPVPNVTNALPVRERTLDLDPDLSG